jgi:hypothetical protein
MKPVIEQAVLDLSANKAPDWHFFSVFCAMVVSQAGDDILTTWGIAVLIHTIGECCGDSEVAQKVFKMFPTPTFSGLGTFFLASFLGTPSDAIFDVLLGYLRERSLEPFLYPTVLIPYIRKTLPGSPELRQCSFVNFLLELFAENANCRAMTASDAELRAIIARISKPVASLLCTGPDDAEIGWWMESGNRLYVEMFARAVNGDRGPGIVGFRIPPHLFAQLARSPEGRSRIVCVLPELVARLSRERERQGALFALGHFASDKGTHGELEKVGAIEAMMGLWANASYSLRGIIVSALSLIPQSRYFAAALERNNWQVFRFGGHTAVFPCDLSVAEGEIQALAIPEAIETNSEVKTLIVQLSSPITVKNAQPSLAKMFQEAPEKLNGLSAWASDFMASYFLQPEIRLFLVKLFARQSLLPHQGKIVISPKDVAVCQAQMFEFLKGQTFESYSTIKVPVVSEGEIDEKRVCSAAPEVYIDDQEFQMVTKMSKDAFYGLDLSKMSEIRKKLLAHEKF